MINKDSIYKIDYLLLLAMLMIIAIGCLAIYSSGFDPIDKFNSGMYKRQIVWAACGLILMMVLIIINYQWLGIYSIHIYAALLILLVMPIFFGTPIRNIKRWIDIGFFLIQPAEFMKLGLIIILAKYMEIRERDMTNLKELLIPTIITILPMIVVIFQPDFGTAIVFIPILFAMLFAGGASIAYLAVIVTIGCFSLLIPAFLVYYEWSEEGQGLFYSFFQNTNGIFIIAFVLLLIAITCFIVNYFYRKKIFKKFYLTGFALGIGLLGSIAVQKVFSGYQKRRILVFLNPDMDPLGAGYNIIQSKITIGSGGFLGNGFLKGSQVQLGFLPEKTTDFIFPVIAEEWGFIGSIVTLGILMFIVLRGIQIALESRDKFGSLLAVGISTLFFTHVMINVGMVMGIVPVTGLPLPFISYGGSNLLTSIIAIGILISIRMRKYVY